MTFDRKSQFDRSFFDRMLSGINSRARIAGKYTVVTRTEAFTMTTRTRAFTVVASV